MNSRDYDAALTQAQQDFLDLCNTDVETLPDGELNASDLASAYAAMNDAARPLAGIVVVAVDLDNFDGVS